MNLKLINSSDHYPILNQARQARFQPPFIAQLGIFILFFILSQLISSIFMAIAIIPSMFQNMDAIVNSPPEAAYETMTLLMGNEIRLTMLFATAATTLLCLLYCRLAEKRPFTSMGFIRPKAAMHYLAGLLAGGLMFLLTALICLFTGSVRIEAVSGASLGFIFLFFLGFLVQGMSEEVMCRGYLMVSLTTRSPVLPAVIANALIFSLMHFFNPNVTFLALFNIFLFGVFCSFYMLYFNNIWGVCALHSAWNFVQGNILGSYVSGMDFKDSFFQMTPIAGYDRISGGSFGVEGGIAMTIVLGIGIVIFLLLLTRQLAARAGEPETASGI